MTISHQAFSVAFAATVLAAVASSQDRLFDLPASEVPAVGAAALGAVGDLDGDGVLDLTVAGPTHGVALTAVSGRTGTAIQQHRAGFELPLLLVDLDGDGILELITTTGLYAGGNVSVRESHGSGALRYVLAKPAGSVSFGSSVTVAGDLDGDGVLDVAVSAPQDAVMVGGQLLAGVGLVYLYSGADGTALGVLRANDLVLGFGGTVAAIGDVDGDAVPDLAVGARGRAFVFSGRSAAMLLELGTADYEGRFGAALASAGDLDGDGTPDVVVGAPQTFLQSPPGYAVVFSGRTGVELLRVTGAQGEFFGSAVAAIDDLDGDGTGELLVGATQSLSVYVSSGPGYVRALSGADGHALFTVRGDVDGDAFGSSLAAVGDVNGDGTADFAASYGLTPYPRSGTVVRVVSGKPLMLVGDRHLASVTAPTAQTLTIDAGGQHGGLGYVVLGSVSGVQPGFDALGWHVPLNLDAWTAFTAGQAGTPVLSGFTGTLDGEGRAAATLTVPQLTALQGLTFDHAAVILDANGIAAISRPVPLTVLP